MGKAALIYPHQLFPHHPALEDATTAILVEDPLLFSQYRFHRKKLILHRASMRSYAQALRQQTNLQVEYVEAGQLLDTGDIAAYLRKKNVARVDYVDPTDDWLGARLADALRQHSIEARVLDDPHFLTPTPEIHRFVRGKKKLYFTAFYIEQRKRMGILLEGSQQPRGGKWSFDPENRKRLPKGIGVPWAPSALSDESVQEARRYVRSSFPDAIGSDEDFAYPTDRKQALAWLSEFVEQKLESFGDYEDAISTQHDALFHSMLTPALNIGLISPQDVVDRALRAPQVPLNSLEGFVRQVIGWREFMRLAYVTKGRFQRTQNFFGFTRKLPNCFYDASTGIEPVDATIRKVLRLGYCHHIERLMILGNFMLLCEIDPDDVYRWFMELFIDAYDWVMVPNVYGMSQFADGGLIVTKPYVGASNYVLKMSDYNKGPWCEIWDGLFWRFVHRHRDVFARNPRLKILATRTERMGEELDRHIQVAEHFLNNLH